MLLLKLLHVSHPVIHIALDMNHKAIEDLEKRLCELRLQHVEKNEKKIVFGDGKSWKDVEAEIFRANIIFCIHRCLCFCLYFVRMLI